MNENTVIKAEDVKKVRPIANNIVDVKRIDPYIHETETLDVMPAIGVGLYEQFTSDSFIEAMSNEDIAVIVTNGGKEISMTPEEWANFLDGCYYTCEECSSDSNSKRYSGGLRAAISYLSYSRMLPNQPINVTAFGIVNKTTALSDPVDEKTLFRAANEAKKIGLEYLRQSVDHLRCKGFIDDGKKDTGKRFRKFKAIG
jgi:hypothetical protein